MALPPTTAISPPPVPASLETYAFPSSRLQRTLSDPTKTPLVLVACGSFSPITHMHLRMFEMAVDHVKQNMSSTHEVVAGYLSPVSDRYNKAGLASALHRVRMCELACNEASTWLMVDPWEAVQPDYQPTAVVLDHFAHCINDTLGGISGVPAKIMLLGGSDLLQTMSQPGVWSAADLAHILGDYGLLVVERNGTDVSEALAPLARWQDNIWIVRQLIANDISSTRIRQLIRQGMSVRYLLPGVVVDYIREHRLYGEHEEFKETRSSSMPPLRITHAKML
ncbi:Nucleotidylyl transferase [Morchella conica CCBAS932]|uniref:Nicotinamide-nucleotide adenylyltransferase n=1 Tax=Morchella conica CCBAS932 TaxID=1392247 RepID=A0A3N4KKX1_9PEZI|nr:Nucleotidylyl transferase [Morchella conica CCBAS932]